jgi:Transposase DDE domain
MRGLSDNRAEEAGYTRFFRNERVTVTEIIETAAARTAEAAAGRDVLVIEDSSEINYESKKGRKRGLGRVGNGTDVGLFVHPALVVDAHDGSVLGLAGATIWRRTKTKQANYQAAPIESKESYRWISTAQAAKKVLIRSTSVTFVRDREADIYEAIVRVPDGEGSYVLVRVEHDRALADAAVEGERLFARIAAQAEAGRTSFELSARPGRPARTVELAVRFTTVTLRQPRLGADKRDPASVTVNIVEAQEIDPPSAEDAVIWRLLTTHHVSSLADALRMVELYRRRWTIEQVFRTLKSQALDVEDSLIADGDALERLAATALVAATMVMQLVHGRDQAGQSIKAARVFDPFEITVIKALIGKFEGKTQKQKNPHPSGCLAWAAWCIARLGGWKGYATERPPGPITFTRGLQRFQAMADGFALATKTIREKDVCER